ncbi:septum site-determining protein MinC [Lactobacillus sp. Sy-1]|uniref:septum site-determining protein MinC n=1 Tax=Lactobacillus sp. Sy-1 TaxID=2109645 RepID=UPI001C55AAE2|nr:septum site-determining protein MinC [Lactobacillus sp. Sy-1]MBW1605805.1 cell division inhibitor [Lactobacillus sp. Sy-1]
MKAVSLKGTKNGYELVLDEAASFTDSIAELTDLLAKLDHDYPTKRMHLDIITGNRLLNDAQRDEIHRLFANYKHLLINGISSNVITIAEAKRIRESENVHVIYQTIRNGQEFTVTGDVLFLGTIHEGGKLVTSGNIYVLGSVHGVIQAGAPNSEDKFIVGDLHTAQQIRIGEQFDIVADKQIKGSFQNVAYVNNLHILDYGKIGELKQINPKFYNRIGGVQ